MVDVARVNLYGQPIGSVRWDQRYEVAQFEYDPDFVRLDIEPSPLMMPVREGRVYRRDPFGTGRDSRRVAATLHYFLLTYTPIKLPGN